MQDSKSKGKQKLRDRPVVHRPSAEPNDAGEGSKKSSRSPSTTPSKAPPKEVIVLDSDEDSGHEDETAAPEAAAAAASGTSTGFVENDGSSDEPVPERNEGRQSTEASENNQQNEEQETKPPEVHPIDDHGDLLLVVTAGLRIREVFRVDSRALARSSDFWNKLISQSPKRVAHPLFQPAQAAPPMSPCTALFSLPPTAMTAGPTGSAAPTAPTAPTAHMASPPVYSPSALVNIDYSLVPPPESNSSNNTSPVRPWYSNSNHGGGSGGSGGSSGNNSSVTGTPQVPLHYRMSTSPATVGSTPSPASPMVVRASSVGPFQQQHQQQQQQEQQQQLSLAPYSIPTPSPSNQYDQTRPALLQAPPQLPPSSTAPAPWTAHIDLADQKAHAAQLRTLLYAAHGRLDHVPTHPTLSEFCSVLVLANRCDMVPIMRGHIHTWLGMTMAMELGDGGDGDKTAKQEEPSASTSASALPTTLPGPVLPLPLPGIPPNLFTYLRIYWEAGWQHEFQACLGQLAWHTQMGDRGELATARQGSRAWWPMAREEVAAAVPGFLETVAAHRLRIIAANLRLLQQRAVLLHSPPAGSKRRAPDQPGRDRDHAEHAEHSEHSEHSEHPEHPNHSCALARKLAKTATATATATGSATAAASDCDAYHYGVLVQELGRKRIDPHGLPAPEAVKKSPHAVCAAIETVHDAIDARLERAQGGGQHAQGGQGDQGGQGSQAGQGSRGAGGSSSSAKGPRGKAAAAAAVFLAGHEHCNPLSPVIVKVKAMRDKDMVTLSEAQTEHFKARSALMGKKFRD